MKRDPGKSENTRRNFFFYVVRRDIYHSQYLSKDPTNGTKENTVDIKQESAS